MKFRLEIELGSADMQTRSQIGAALERTATTLTAGGTTLVMFAAIQSPIPGDPIRDTNGHTIGKWEVVANA